MSALAESFMLLCFGVSWPVSVYKSYKSHTAAGKSLVFMVVIVIGYLFGIAGKLASGNVTYVLALYGVNIAMVSTDILLYFRNRRYDLRQEPLGA